MEGSLKGEKEGNTKNIDSQNVLNCCNTVLYIFSKEAYCTEAKQKYAL